MSTKHVNCQIEGCDATDEDTAMFRIPSSDPGEEFHICYHHMKRITERRDELTRQTTEKALALCRYH